MYLNFFLKWDVSKQKEEFPEVIKKIFFKKSFKLRKKYTNWIGELSKPYSKDIDWWVSTPSSRNPNFSKVFDAICILETLKELKNYQIEITTHSSQLFSEEW